MFCRRIHVFVLALSLSSIQFFVSNQSASAQQNRWGLDSDEFGTWHVTAKENDPWHVATIPATNEANLSEDGYSFDGECRYRLTIDLAELEGLDHSDAVRTWLDFKAVATRCTVFLIESGDRKELGQHLGGWTPFRFEISDAIQESSQATLVFELVVDELEGHNTQGFLPIVEPHFGGIWQNVSIVQTPQVFIDQLKSGVVGVVENGDPSVLVDIEVDGKVDTGRLQLRYRRVDETRWINIEHPLQLDPEEKVTQRIPLGDIDRWSPETPTLYEFELALELMSESKWKVVDRMAIRTGFREMSVDGSKLVLNGEPIVLRGILNWGYQTSHLGPTVSEEDMREELQLVKDWGFNMMKFCLWVPPKRYLELADELGVLVWMEYPTWHPKMTKEYQQELLREYDEFYCFDRTHPSIVLRSLTCETGPSADLDVLRSLYDAGKKRIPNALIEDDSSWIQWNRIHDFYDDHPYGNNHTWPTSLKRLQDYIAERKPLPLMLGEAIAADTWFEPTESELALSPRPFWLPGFAEANSEWLSEVQRLDESVRASQLIDDSNRYAMLMRKYQIERYRTQVPDGGYVVSVIRDFPLAGMGLLDFRGQRKWPDEQWAWHGPRTIVIHTMNDWRSCFAGQSLPIDLSIANDEDETISNAKLDIKWTLDDDSTSFEIEIARLNGNQVWQTTDSRKSYSIDVPSTDIAAAMNVEVKLISETGTVLAENSWELWVVPRSEQERAVNPAPSWDLALPPTYITVESMDDQVRLTRKLDQDTLNHLKDGGNVILVPNDQPGSMALSEHWFLRGAPVIWTHPLTSVIPHQFWIDLQHFDLSSPVLPDWKALDQVQPIATLWDNHDIKEVRTHGLMFEIPVGQGRMIVTPMLKQLKQNAAQQFLFDTCLAYLEEANELTASELGRANLERISREINRRELDLTSMTWKFKPDPEKQGFTDKWFAKDVASEQWADIRVDRHWDSQGYGALDGWAWYQIRIKLPADWPTKKAYLSFTGVDDHYRAFVNGKEVGSGGVIETKETAFEARASHLIEEEVGPEKELTVTVAVYDWYGAGGIFRPVSITTEPLSTERPWLK